MWEVIDQNGTVHSGTEEEMREAFSVMTSSSNEWDFQNWKEMADKWITDWNGDLKLIEIHSIDR